MSISFHTIMYILNSECLSSYSLDDSCFHTIMYILNCIYIIFNHVECTLFPYNNVYFKQQTHQRRRPPL